MNTKIRKLFHYVNKFKEISKKDGLNKSVRKVLFFFIRLIKAKWLKYKSPYKHLSPTSDHKEYISVEIKQHVKNIKRLNLKTYIVIPSFEDTLVLKNCIESIQKYGKGIVEKIIISDDCSQSKQHTDYLLGINDHNYDIQIEVIRSEENTGFSKNVNRGFSKVPSEANILLLNSDTVLHYGAIESLLDTAITNKALVGARLLYPNSTIQHGGGIRNTSDLRWFDHLYRGKETNHIPALVTSYSLFCTGAALMITSYARKKIGHFDEEFQMSFEDVDYCLRAWISDVPVIYCGAAEIVHHESITRGLKIGSRELKSQQYFWEKYNKFFNQRSVFSDSGVIRVIFVLKDTGMGGGHRVIFNYANFLSKNNFEVEIWTCATKPTWFVFDENIKFRDFNNFKQMEFELEPINALKVATWWETSETVWKSALRNGIPIWLAQDIESSYYANDNLNAMRCLATYKPEFVYIINYKWIKAVFEQYFGYETNFIGLGIDHDKFYYQNLKRAPKSILVSARGERLKGFDYAKEIISILMNNGFNVTAYGNDISLVEDLPKITFVKNPSDDELRVLYNTHQFFLQTSIHEGLSLPPLEAMACDCIPIVTDATGNKDYIVDGYNCIEINRNLNNAVHKIANLEWDKIHPTLKEGMLKTIQNYRWDDSYIRLLNLFNEIANNPVYSKTKVL